MKIVTKMLYIRLLLHPFLKQVLKHSAFSVDHEYSPYSECGQTYLAFCFKRFHFMDVRSECTAKLNVDLLQC